MNAIQRQKRLIRDRQAVARRLDCYLSAQRGYWHWNSGPVACFSVRYRSRNPRWGDMNVDIRVDLRICPTPDVRPDEIGERFQYRHTRGQVWPVWLPVQSVSWTVRCGPCTMSREFDPLQPDASVRYSSPRDIYMLLRKDIEATGKAWLQKQHPGRLSAQGAA